MPFFHGQHVLDQIDKIVAVLGAQELIDYVSHYKLHIADKFNVDWSANTGYLRKVPEEVLDRVHQQ